MGKKLLVDSPTGMQQLIEVGPGGGYFDPARVLWDEDVDGTFPSASIADVGGIKRSGKNLNFDATRKAQHDAAKKTLIDDPATAKANRRALIKLIKNATTIAEVRQILLAIALELGFDADQ